MLHSIFIAAESEVDAASLADLPLEPSLAARGIDATGLRVLARVLMKKDLGDSLFLEGKPSHEELDYSDTGEPSRESMIQFLRKYRAQEIEDDGAEIEELDDADLQARVFGGPRASKLHSAFVAGIAEAGPDRLESIATQWAAEWAREVEDPSLTEPATMKALRTYPAALARIARDALTSKKHLYYFESL